MPGEGEWHETGGLFECVLFFALPVLTNNMTSLLHLFSEAREILKIIYDENINLTKHSLLFTSISGSSVLLVGKQEHYIDVKYYQCHKHRIREMNTTRISPSSQCIFWGV